LLAARRHEMPKRVRPPALALLLTASSCLASAAAAQQPWIDAGQQAMVQHYNDLIEQQSAPDQEGAVEDARRRPPAETDADERCDPEAVRAKLRPEYDRRLQSEGAAAAESWLRRQAEEAGRYAARNC
jgi:hypothetical protein